MRTTQSVTVTIGRNIPTRHRDAAREDGFATLSADPSAPDRLSSQAWENFTDLVKDALGLLAVETAYDDSWWIEQHDGTAEWEGVAEESRKLTLLLTVDGQIPESARDTLIQELLSARTGFYQDAAALSFGQSVLV